MDKSLNPKPFNPKPCNPKPFNPKPFFNRLLDRVRLKAYTSLFVARFSLLLQYRAAAFAGIMTQLFWGALKVMVLAAFFANSTAVQPMTLPEAIGYTWLGQAFIMALVPWSGDREVQGLIRSGAVSYDLLRPLDLYNFWFVRALAQRTVPIVLRAVPILMIAMGVLPILGLSGWSLAFPTSFAAWIAFLISLMAAVVLAASINMLLTVSLMWTISGEGINSILPTLVIIFSGMTIPLPLFPDWLQPLFNFLPFPGLLDRPFRLFTGNLPANALLPVLLHQIIWIIILIAIGRFFVSRGVKKLVIQGG